MVAFRLLTPCRPVSANQAVRVELSPVSARTAKEDLTRPRRARKTRSRLPLSWEASTMTVNVVAAMSAARLVTTSI
jgi:hypothetical protein